jgi:uncharacterized repeat protein (TIGR01451 family)
LVPLMFDPTPSDFRVPAPPEVRLRAKGLSSLQAAVTVTYLPPGTQSNGDICVAWSAPAQAAFSYAASVWASQLQSPVPITIDACYANNLGTNVLGHAGARLVYANFAGAPVPNTYYPSALANARAGVDRDAAVSDIYAAFSSTFTWYYGTDGNTPPGQVDFASVVLHEIGHGLGFIGTMDVTTGSGSWGLGTGKYPLAYDRFTQNAAAQWLIDPVFFLNPSTTLAAALQSTSGVFFSGTNANAANGGARVPLYAPATWADGSSYLHLAESYNNTPNALMTFSMASGESIHSPGPVTLGLLSDLGWQLQTASTADVALTQTINPNPAVAGKDVVFTMTATNNGPGTATGVSVTATYDSSATVIWASPGCVKSVTAVFTCNVGALGNGLSTQFKLVLRKGVAGSVFNNAVVSSATVDPNAANNSPAAAVSIGAAPAAAQVFRYRLYSPVTLEHHFTTDLNEYNVLGSFIGTWVQEGTVGKVLDNPGSFNGVSAAPYYRLYNGTTRWHHWTTDANEYYTLIQFPGWNGEGVDGYILPTQPAGAIALYRLLYPFVAGLHHWTVDPVEYNALITTYGWIGEGGSGFVIQ